VPFLLGMRWLCRFFWVGLLLILFSVSVMQFFCLISSICKRDELSDIGEIHPEYGTH
jgi:hypothetical protein